VKDVVEVVTLLLKNGADPTIRDNFSRDAFAISAGKRANRRLKPLLEEFKNKNAYYYL
jgi:ankyrin repeat protein